MTRIFAKDFEAGEIGYNCGLVHDLGKYSLKAQLRLTKNGEKVDHATAGAMEVFKVYNEGFAKIMAYCISGHHSGLLDYGSENKSPSLARRLYKKVEDYSGYKTEIVLPELSKRPFRIKNPKANPFYYYFLIKMLFSCLVDADFLDTEAFMNPEKFALRSQYEELGKLQEIFNEYMNKLMQGAKNNKINQNRAEIYRTCVKAAKNPTGLFSLSVPTGGGKTLSSMGFALEHAKTNGLKRIIYVIPYTSIIEQNAQEYRDIFSDRNVLEHHSNFSFREDDLYETPSHLKLASENWDMPIITTTAVQFFESIFSKKTSRSRKLHNLSKSVIILDEAQMMPVQYLEVCVNALCEIATNYNSSVVLCTATQPNLQSVDFFSNTVEIKEIIEEPDALYEAFRRTKINKIGEVTDAELVELLRGHKQALCIVNRRNHAELLFNALKDEENIYHLSTRMCPAHRKRTIKKIKEHLKAGNPCKVISTQLIEAGVNIDFPVVFRSMAGLDSIIQAAGRCNREGKKEMAEVFVFTPTEKHAQPPKEIQMNVSEAESVFRNYDDPLSIEAINKYFELLYDSKNTDSKDLMGKIKNNAKSLEFPFAAISDVFKLIETPTISVIVPYKDGDDETDIEALLDELRFSEYPNSVIRKLQPYTVSIYEHEFNQIRKNGGLKAIGNEDMFFYISDMGLFYSNSTGIILEHEDLKNDFYMF